MIATLGFACAACGVKFKPGIDFVLRLADAARPVRMKRPWGHAACCMRLLSSGGFITEANLQAAISAYEVRTQEAHARTGQATDAVTQTPEPMQPVVDEHARIVCHSTTCERPAVILIMAGAGSGKTTYCNSIVKANPTRTDGTPATVIAVSTTRAGCKALKQMPDIPPNVVHTGHALGLRALSAKYRSSHLDGMDFDESGNLSDIDTRPKSVTKSSAKHTIMLQQMLPCVEADRGCSVSLTYRMIVGFVQIFAEKLLIFGFGIPGQPDYDDFAGGYELVQRFGLQLKIEAAVQKFSFTDRQRCLETFKDEETRLQFAMYMTAQLLFESVHVSWNPTWRHRQTWKSANSLVHSFDSNLR